MKKIIVFVIAGCAACAEYEPRFVNVMASNSISHEIIDLTKTTPEWQQIAKAFDVYAFPSTLIMNEKKVELIEGNVSEEYLLSKIKKCFG